MHKCVYNQYAEQLEGGERTTSEQNENFLGIFNAASRQKITEKQFIKSTSLNKYNQAILAFLINDELITSNFYVILRPFTNMHIMKNTF